MNHFFKKYHQKGANLNNPNQNNALIPCGKNYYHHIGNAYHEFAITITKNVEVPNNPEFFDNDTISLKKMFCIVF